MKRIDLMKRLVAPVIGATLLATSLFVVACTSTEFGQMVETGVLLSEKDPEKAKKAGDVARGLSGSLGEVSLETERALGSGVAVRAYTDIGTRYANEDLQHYVNLVGRSVSRQSGRPDVLYAFAVIDSPTPNAFAGPGGYIFVTTGAIQMMETESELAGVLAHEVAHVTQKHMLKTYQRSNFINAVSEGATLFKEDVAQYTKAVDFASDTLFNKGLDQKFEYEADLVGCEVAAMAGYDPSGLENFLVRLERSTDHSGGWFSTHPPLNQRIQRLNSKVATDFGGEQGIMQAERFQSMKRRSMTVANAGQTTTPGRAEAATATPTPATRIVSGGGTRSNAAGRATAGNRAVDSRGTRTPTPPKTGESGRPY